MFNHKCIKCKASYEDTDPDPYYCVSCKEESQRIAAEIDKKAVNVSNSEREKSILKAYDSLPKRRGFVSASDLHNLGFL